MRFLIRIWQAIRPFAGPVAVFIERFVTGAPWHLRLLLAVLTAAAQLVLSRPFLSPCRWEELAIAFGLRQPLDGLSGLWSLLFSALAALFDPEAVLLILWLTGAVAAGLIVYLCDLLFDWFMPSLLRARLLLSPKGLLWKHVLTGGGAVLFVCSDAVWRSCQAPGVTLCQIVGILSTVVFLLVAQRGGKHYSLPFVTFALGLLTGDGFFAAAIFAVMMTYIGIRASGKFGLVANVLSNPIVSRAVTARAVCGYLLGLMTVCITNVLVYGGRGGVPRTTTTVGDVLQTLVVDPLSSVADAFSSGAVVFLLIVIVIPFCIICFAIVRLWPKTGVSSPLFLVPVVGTVAVALSQLTGFGCLPAFYSTVRQAGDFTWAVWTFGGLLAVVWGLACLVARAHSIGNVWWRCGILFLSGLAAVILYGTSLPSRVRPVENLLADVVETYCNQVAEACADDTWLLTDGSLDAGVELASWRRGSCLFAVSTVSGNEPRDVALRQRGVTDAEDLAALESGGADALRDWLEVRTNALAVVAAQAGFDRRRHFADGVEPRYSGLVAHFGGLEGAAERTGRAAARALGWRIVSICRENALTGRVEPALLEAFRFVQWRVSLACRQRLGNPKTPVKELTADTTLSDELDRLNPSMGAIRRAHGWQVEYHGALLLPREGVRIAMAKADFKLAGYYAEQVLKASPDDAEANFALGMSHYLNRQFARAIPNLKRVLEVQGENPGVLNNLAMAYVRLERWDEAAEMARRAVRAAPNDAAIRKTAERILGKVRARQGAEK